MAIKSILLDKENRIVLRGNGRRRWSEPSTILSVVPGGCEHPRLGRVGHQNSSTLASNKKFNTSFLP